MLKACYLVIVIFFGFLCFDDKILTNIKSIFIFFSHARKERQCILFSCQASQLNNLAEIKISKVSICGWIVMKVYLFQMTFMIL